RPPFELRLPPRADRDDRDLGQPPLDRRAEPQLRPQRGQPPPRARRRDKRVERPGQSALRGQDQVAPPVDDAIPQLLPLGLQLLTSHIRNPAHSPNNNQRPAGLHLTPPPPAPAPGRPTAPTPSRPSFRPTTAPAPRVAPPLADSQAAPKSHDPHSSLYSDHVPNQQIHW